MSFGSDTRTCPLRPTETSPACHAVDTRHTHTQCSQCNHKHTHTQTRDKSVNQSSGSGFGVRGSTRSMVGGLHADDVLHTRTHARTFRVKPLMRRPLIHLHPRTHVTRRVGPDAIRCGRASRTQRTTTTTTNQPPMMPVEPRAHRNCCVMVVVWWVKRTGRQQTQSQRTHPAPSSPEREWRQLLRAESE